MDEFLKWFGFWGTLLALVIGILGTYYAWKAKTESERTQRLLEKEKARLSEKIEIILTDGKNKHPLPSLRRQDVTRSEIQGRLGVIPMKVKGKRYSIKFTESPEFYKQIDLVSADPNELENSSLISNKVGDLDEETKDSGSNKLGNSSLTINCTKEEYAQFNFDLPKIETEKRVKKVKENNGK